MMTIGSEAQMQEFGKKLGRSLKGGEVIELVGDVGAGKTTMVRGIAAGMGIDETVQSPSFTINRVYDAPEHRRLVHYDFYRLTDTGIMANELAEAMMDQETSVVIEWADVVGEILPKDRLTIRIVSTTETARELTFTSGGEKSRLLEEAIQ